MTGGDRDQQRFFMTRMVPMDRAGRKFDIAYWQRQGTAAIFEAAWQMILEAHARGAHHGEPLAFQRSVGGFRQTQS